MAFTNQVFVKELSEINPVGPGSLYSAQTLLDHLIAWFTANTGGWTISASGANHLELQPPGTAINTADRILFWGGATMNAAALALGANNSAAYLYVCMAPNAGTTGPDNLPSVGDPYTGVISSKMAIASSTVAVESAMQVFQSDDVICLRHHIDSSKLGTGCCMVGRWFNPVGTANQLPAVAGMGKGNVATWSEPALTGNTTEWSCDPNPTTGDPSIFVQETVGDVAWTQCRRANSWLARGYNTANLLDGNFFKIDLMRTTPDTGDPTVFIGWPLFALGGPPSLHGKEIADSVNNLGFAMSYSALATGNSTWYLMNEALA